MTDPINLCFTSTYFYIKIKEIKYCLFFKISSRPGRPPKRHAQSDSENPNNDSQEKNSDSNLSPTNSSKASKSNCQTGHGKGLAIKANTSTDQHHTASSMSPYSILTSSSCSSSVPAMDTSDLASPSNQQAASLMQKFGFLPYPLNGFHSSNNSNKFLLKNPYETNGHQLGDDNMNGFGYDSESLNSINNAAAAYAIYGRMLQQQVRLRISFCLTIFLVRKFS